MKINKLKSGGGKWDYFFGAFLLKNQQFFNLSLGRGSV